MKASLIVIDDDPDTVDVFCEYLKLKGFDVKGHGYSGKEAVQLYIEHRPDIVLMDVMMPEFNGFYGLENHKAQRSSCKNNYGNRRFIRQNTKKILQSAVQKKSYTNHMILIRL